MECFLYGKNVKYQYNIDYDYLNKENNDIRRIITCKENYLYYNKKQLQQEINKIKTKIECLELNKHNNKFFQNKCVLAFNTFNWECYNKFKIDNFINTKQINGCQILNSNYNVDSKIVSYYLNYVIKQDVKFKGVEWEQTKKEIIKIIDDKIQILEQYLNKLKYNMKHIDTKINLFNYF